MFEKRDTVHTSSDKGFFGYSKSKPEGERGEVSLGIFNRVGDRSNLSYQNVAALLRYAFVNIGDMEDEIYDKKNSETHEIDVVVISDDPGITSLKDSINRFADSAAENCSIALCKGNIVGGEIVGDTHWTALSLRKVRGEDGKTVIQAFHTDSMGLLVPASVSRVFNEMKDDLLRRDIVLENCLANGGRVDQEDGYSCGYHAVFNLLRMRLGVDLMTADERLQDIDKFIADGKRALKEKFNKVVAADGYSKALGKLTHEARALISDVEKLFKSQGPLDQLGTLSATKEVLEKEINEKIVSDFFRRAINNCLLEVRSKISESESNLDDLMGGFTKSCINDETLKDPSILLTLFKEILEKESSKEARDFIVQKASVLDGEDHPMTGAGYGAGFVDGGDSVVHEPVDVSGGLDLLASIAVGRPEVSEGVAGGAEGGGSQMNSLAFPSPSVTRPKVEGKRGRGGDGKSEEPPTNLAEEPPTNRARS